VHCESRIPLLFTVNGMKMAEIRVHRRRVVRESIQEAPQEFQTEYEQLKVLEMIGVRLEGDEVKVKFRVSDDVFNELFGIQQEAVQRPVYLRKKQRMSLEEFRRIVK